MVHIQNMTSVGSTADNYFVNKIDPVNDSKIEQIRFDPPLYRQRYHHVSEILERERVKSVVDLGCSEHKVIPAFKCVPTIERITCVDIDYDAINSNLHLTQPLVTDYLARRARPLVISLYHGDAQLYDARLAETESVTLIEVIEHLCPKTLEAVVKNIFMNLHPRVIIVTTPNIEYNIVFGNCRGFRHWDHKFEWTRDEFQKWCDMLALEHGYSVSYSGVGAPPPDKPDIGYCTQVAHFKVDGEWHSSVPAGMEDCMPYKLVVESIHPHATEQLNMAEALSVEMRYYLRMLTKQCLGDDYVENPSYAYDSIRRQLRVAPSFLLRLSHIKKICSDVDTLISVLLNEGFQFTDDNTYLIHSVPADDTSDRSDDGDGDCDNGGHNCYNGDENGVNGSGVTDYFVNDFNSDTEDWNYDYDNKS